LPIHDTYIERLIQLIDLVGGRFEPGDPFQRFRRRSFVVMLMILALITLIQAITAWVSGHALIIFVIMTILFSLVIFSIFITRRSLRIEPTASIVLIFLVVMGALLEVVGGRSPNTPLVYWSPVMVFGGYVFCGLQRGTLVAAVIMLSTLAIIVLPFMMNDARVLPAGGDSEAFDRRLFVTVLLCHVLPLAILGMYEKFFALCHIEARNLFDKLEVRKDRNFLARLAKVLVGEMEPELGRMEMAYQDLQHGKDVQKATNDVMVPLQKLVHLTRRYEPLSIGTLAAIDKGLALQDFPDILKRFTDFSEIRLEGPAHPDFRFQDGQSFFLLMFLCLCLRELMENPRVTLELVTLHHRDISLQVIIQVIGEDEDLQLSLAQDFLHDMGAQIQVLPMEKGTLSRVIGINVPLLRT
jgi:hypothetical protein